MLFRQLVDSQLAQYAYLIGCQRTKEALVIDPERDVDRYLELAAAEGLTIKAVADTHIHADYVSGTREFAERGVKVYASAEGGPDWQYEWLKSGRYDYQLLHHGDSFRIGNIEIKAVHTPGHTPEHLSYLVIDHGGGVDEPMGIATGDFVFVGDLGRPDLLESAAGQVGAMRPAAERLFKSLDRFLTLPDHLQVWPGHGAGSACGKALGAVPASTVGYERRFNAAIRTAGQGEGVFVESILEGQPEPPLYFARMKRVNRGGPDVLGHLPQPREIALDEIKALVGRQDVVIVDTRADRTAFMKGHLPGSVYAPFDKTFPTIVGSYIEPGPAIYLVIDPESVDAAVRSLVRIGLDRVEGFIAPATLARYQAGGGALTSTRTIDFGGLKDVTGRPDTAVLDVRGKGEYQAAHVAGAINIAHTRLVPRLSEVPKDKTLVVHCGVGSRAASAASYLERQGYRVIYVNDAFANRPEPAPTP